MEIFKFLAFLFAAFGVTWVYILSYAVTMEKIIEILMRIR